MTRPASRLALIGDIHAQHERLAVLLDVLPQLAVDEVLSTGDIVDGNGDVDACIDLLQSAGVRTVRGNHDRWLLEDKARHVPHAHRRDELGAAALDFLGALPAELEVPTVRGSLLLCHGIGPHDLKKVWPGTERMPVERSAALDRIIHSRRYRYLVNGHMHFKTIFRFNMLTMINAGTLMGDRWPGFSVLDLDADQVEVYRFADNALQSPVMEPLRSGDFDWQDTRCFTGGWTPHVLGGR